MVTGVGCRLELRDGLHREDKAVWEARCHTLAAAIHQSHMQLTRVWYRMEELSVHHNCEQLEWTDKLAEQQQQHNQERNQCAAQCEQDKLQWVDKLQHLADQDKQQQADWAERYRYLLHKYHSLDTALCTELLRSSGRWN